MAQSEQPAKGQEPASPGTFATEVAEAWEGWETRLCLWSLAIGLGGLVILGVLVNVFLL
jgi:hypothetical protein